MSMDIFCWAEQVPCGPAQHIVYVTMHLFKQQSIFSFCSWKNHQFFVVFVKKIWRLFLWIKIFTDNVYWATFYISVLKAEHFKRKSYPRCKTLNSLSAPLNDNLLSFSDSLSFPTLCCRCSKAGLLLSNVLFRDIFIIIYISVKSHSHRVSRVGVLMRWNSQWVSRRSAARPFAWKDGQRLFLLLFCRFWNDHALKDMTSPGTQSLKHQPQMTSNNPFFSP